jgi:Fe2+ transport system protein B
LNTKILLTTSAIFLGLIGLGLSFLPKETLTYLNISSNQILSVILQILGSLYLGFAIMNWMAKESLIGGIYNRPIAIGNFMHFSVGAISLMKIVFGIQVHAEIIISLTVIYTILALCFAYVFLTNPSKVRAKK